jgi:hypothetical protein
MSAAEASKSNCGVTCISIGTKLFFYERLINIKNSEHVWENKYKKKEFYESRS